ncbi:FAD-dependent monooxygenase [Stappia sp. BW2]|uniref:flavin-dependent monooxygenase QhpG n=1 Tax=Stappia sp. BW2 TaxID=2592622 RepID=UPI0011DEA596|nr:NAD(P)/FAD-dependent oxidoreductase [Stappia sp. BW2]TYC68293.1 FAD-dependent monooxygenase [Stappia sp. BW2]
MTHDVAIIGGGPAGSAVALRLAELGHQVVLIERSTFPRPHVGICLSHQTVQLLDHLGAGNSFRAAGHWQRRTTLVLWDGVTRQVDNSGFHVDRGLLDHDLLARAVRAGVDLHQPAQLRSISHSAHGHRLTLANGTVLETRFVVDAGGRRPAVPGQRVHDGPPLLALHATWRFAAQPVCDGLIEASESAWLWCARSGPTDVIQSVFVDPRNLQNVSGDRLQELYLRLLARFSLSLLTGTQSSQVEACDASSRHAKLPIDGGMIRVGDAALTVDPLASQGVHLALTSGLQAAAIVNTILKRPASATLAQSFYVNRVASRVALYSAHTGNEYARAAAAHNTKFWIERAATAARLQQPISPPPAPSDYVGLSPALSLTNSAVIEDDFVVKRRVVQHPNLEGCIKYLAGDDLPQLLASLPRIARYERLVACLKQQSPKGALIADWLWHNALLVRLNR